MEQGTDKHILFKGIVTNPRLLLDRLHNYTPIEDFVDPRTLEVGAGSYRLGFYERRGFGATGLACLILSIPIGYDDVLCCFSYYPDKVENPSKVEEVLDALSQSGLKRLSGREAEEVRRELLPGLYSPVPDYEEKLRIENPNIGLIIKALSSFPVLPHLAEMLFQIKELEMTDTGPEREVIPEYVKKCKSRRVIPYSKIELFYEVETDTFHAYFRLSYLYGFCSHDTQLKDFKKSISYKSF